MHKITKSGRKVNLPSNKDDALINAGIAQDSDNPEWTDEDFKNAVPFGQLPPNLQTTLNTIQRRGTQVAPVKKAVSIRLDADVVTGFKAQGKGWQSRINEVLKKHLSDLQS